MNVQEARRFIEEHNRAVLVTRRPSGGLQTSPVVVGVDEGGRVVISSREAAYKVRNLDKDPRAVLCVMDDRFFGPWIQVEGTASIVRLPEAMEGLIDYYRRVSGEHPDWDDYRAAMERDERVLVRVDIERAGPERSG